MIQGLGLNEAVKSGSSLMVSLEPNTKYLVGGKAVTTYYTVNSICIEYDVDVFKVIQHPEVTEKYVNGDLQELSVEDYHNKRRELTDPYWNEEDEEIKYPDLDTEFRVRKQLQELYQYKAINYKKADEYLPVDIKIVGEIIPTGSKYIENAISIGRAKFTNGNFYKVNLSGAVAEEAFKFIDDNDLRSAAIIPTHTNVRFLQIRGNYVLPESIEGVKDNCVKYCQTLEQAQKIESDARRTVRKHLELVVIPTTLDKVTSAQIYAELLSLQSTVNGLDVKTKSIHGWNNAKKKIRELIDVLRS